MMKYSVSPVVQVAVEPKNASDLPKLMEGLKRLSKSDPLVQTYTAKTGEHIVAGCGELHIEICIKDLAEDFMKGAPIRVSEPVVSFCETVSEETTADCIGKSPNKHNRIYLRAQPMGEEVCKAIEEEKIFNTQDFKKRARILADEYEWEVAEARKIWTFGSLDSKCNVLVDTTKAVQYLNEVKDSMNGAFIQACSAGIILEENCRGIRFNLMDVKLHADAIHRGAGQIMPPFKRAFYCCQLRSGPKIMEPYYICNITVPQQAMSGVYTTLSGRRGEVVAQEDRDGTPITVIKAYLPVMESFGFTQVLRQNTSGQAFPQLSFDHWGLMSGDMYDENAKCGEVVREVRKRKGLKDVIPVWQSYYDKV
jgi:elongation factor 2